jgi:hypothetical protein
MPPPDSSAEYRDYENGVADIIAFLGAGATVRRNVRLPGRLSETPRQVDVCINGELLGKADATLIVDCKRWSEPLDVADVGSFIDLARDVGADFGLLVSLRGASASAKRRALTEEIIAIRALSLAELAAWRPPGTVVDTIRIPVLASANARRILRHAGYRVAPGGGFPCPDDEQLIEVLRHYGVLQPEADVQSLQMADIETKLATGAISSTHVAHAIVIGGGTPANRWLQVRIAGEPLDKVLASNASEVNEQLKRVARLYGFERTGLTVDIPDDWPVVDIFELGI